MLYRKIKNQIAEQTREDLGFVKIDGKTGSMFTRTSARKTTIPNRTESFKWGCYYYLRNNTVGNDKIFPILYKTIFDQQYPSYQYLQDYYVFWDHAGKYYGISIVKTEIQGESNGSFILRDIPAFYNGFIYATFSGNGSKQTYLPINIGSNHITMSVWAQINNINQSEFQILYHSGLSGMNDQWVNISIPIGEVSTDLIILIYNYDDNAQTMLTNKYGKPIKTSLIPESGEIKSDTYLNISMDISNITTHAQINNPLSSYTPTLDPISPIVTTVDPTTHNVINKINIQNTNIFPVDSYVIFRKEENNIILNDHESNRNIYDIIQLNTSNSSLFYGDANILADNRKIPIQGSFLSKANKINNSDFSDYSGSRLNNWYQQWSLNGMSTTQVGTSYPYFGDWMYNGNCIRIDAYKTTTSKSIHFDTGRSYDLIIDTTQPEYIRFNWQELSTSHAGKFRMIIYSSSDKTTTLDTVIPLNYYSYQTNPSDPNGWNTFEMKLYPQPTADAFLIPSDSKYFRPQWYAVYNSSVNGSYLFDGIHYGQLGNTYIFSTSQSDQVIAKLYDKYEIARNHLTGFHSYFANNTYDYSNTKQASSVLGQPRYYSSSNSTNIRFDYGIECLDSATNEFKNPTLYPDTATNLWTVNNATYSTVNGYSLFSNDGYAHIYINKQQYGSLTYNGIINRGVKTNWTMAIWAKSNLPDQQFRMILGDGINTSGATYYVTSSWSMYSMLYTNFTGSNITAYIENVNNNELDLDIAGIQASGDLTICPGFVSTVGAITGLQYTSSSDIFSQEYGTVRLWYSPNLDYSTGNANRFLWKTETHDGGYYKGIYYDKSSNNFRFINHNNTTYSLAEVATTFATGEPIHLVATWDTSKSYLYVNGIQSDSAQSYYNSTAPANFSIGWWDDYGSGHGANGIIQNFRIDKTVWSSADIKQDYLAYYTLLNASSLTVSKDMIIGEQDAHLNDSTVTFTDDIGLLNNSLYKYVVRAKDKFGNLSPASDVSSSYTYRQPFEFNTKNKIANGSFEVLDPNTDFPIYWSTGNSYGNLVSTSMYRFVGHRSVYGIFGPKLLYQYVSINDTSIPITISWYSLQHNPFTPVDHMDIKFLDAKWQHIGTFSATNSTDYTITTAKGLDGLEWIRYATTIATSNASYKQSRYWRIYLWNNNNSFMIDAVQAEDGNSATEFSEGYFIKSGNLGRDSIGGDAIAFNSLVGRHLYTGELIISGDEYDANRIVIGKESTPNSFAILSTSNFLYHSPGMAIASGWNYTKHVENGSGVFFGSTVGYSKRFYPWVGTAKAPMVIITPEDVITFSSAGLPATYDVSQIYPQKLKFYVSESTPGGFVANAMLYQDKNSFINENIDSIYIDNAIHDTYLEIHDYTSSQFGSTALTSTSLSNYGSFKYQMAIAFKDNQPTFEISLYSTSSASASFTTTSWSLIATENRSVPSGTNQYFTMQFAASAFNGARAICVKLNTLDYLPPSSLTYCDLEPTYISYSTASVTILLQDSAIGKFAWTALDGGRI